MSDTAVPGYLPGTRYIMLIHCSTWHVDTAVCFFIEQYLNLAVQYSFFLGLTGCDPSAFWIIYTYHVVLYVLIAGAARVGSSPKIAYYLVCLMIYMLLLYDRTSRGDADHVVPDTSCQKTVSCDFNRTWYYSLYTRIAAHTQVWDNRDTPVSFLVFCKSCNSPTSEEFQELSVSLSFESFSHTYHGS